jgi:predicted dehydrogenase
VNPSDPMRAVVVGAGYMGCRHLDAYLAAPGVVPVAAVCRTATTALRLEERYGPRGVFVTQNLGVALDRFRPALVSVCSPTEWHRRHASEALTGGAHVLVEKPLATTLDEGRAILKAAEEARRTLMVAHTTLFEPASVALWQLVRCGALGSVQRIRFERRGLDVSPGEIEKGRIHEMQPPQDDPSRGWLYDHLIHVAYLVNRFAAAVPRAVRVAERAQSTRRQTLRAEIDYKNGVLAEIALTSRDEDPFEKGLTVVGASGRGEWRLAGGQAALRVCPAGGDWHDVSLGATSGFDATVFHFVNSVQRKRAPLETGAAGLRAMALAAALAGGFPSGGAT